jgi:type II secretory pathway pseudopilin PulG
MPSLKLNQVGDTIVEVLIASAVVGLVITGAFRSANFSAAAVQRSRERTEAVKVTESQIELIREAVISGSPDTSGASFCIWYDTATSEFKKGSAPSTECTFDHNGNVDGRYNVSVENAAGKYTISTTWDAFGLDQTDSIVMYYSAGS